MGRARFPSAAMGRRALSPCSPAHRALYVATPPPFRSLGALPQQDFYKGEPHPCLPVVGSRCLCWAAGVGQWRFGAAWRPAASAAVLGSCGQPYTPGVTCAVGIYFGALLVLYLLYSLPMSYIKVGWGQACCT